MFLDSFLFFVINEAYLRLQSGRGCMQIAADLGHDELLVYLVSEYFAST
jgi:hypothetical protein